jgi:hypothetical protein
MPALDGWKEAAFVGYFGPIGLSCHDSQALSLADDPGVGTLYWTSEALEYLPDTPNRQHLREVLMPINYFLIVFSVLVHGTSIGFFQATRSVVGKGHPEPQDDPPIPIRPGADIYISASNLQSRGDLELSRTSTRRQSAREYLSRHISIPNQGDNRPSAYRSQLDLALERSNTRRASARDYLDRTITIDPEAYNIDRRDSMDDPKSLKSPVRSRTRSPPPPIRTTSNLSMQRTDTDPVSATSGHSGNGSGNRISRLDWIRRGKMARGEPISDEEESSPVERQRSVNASNRV